MLNDTYGYEEGDVVLKKVVACVYEVIRNSDILIRWNGDEFVGVFYGINRGNIDKFADKILSSVSDLSVDYKGTAVHVTVSLGFSFYDEEDMDYEVAVRRADNAMYEAKRNGRNQYRIR